MGGRKASKAESVAGSSGTRKRKHSTSGEKSVTSGPRVGPSATEAKKLKMSKPQKKVAGSGAADAKFGGAKLTILSLLNEVSPQKIMRFLPSTDRKRCRLTCKEWYQLCAVYEDQEKICIPSAFSSTLDAVLSVFIKSKRSCFHFEFYAINFNKKTRTAFWTACGSKIRSLKMINCKTTNPVIGGIVAHCSNLQELEFYFNDIEHMRYGIIISYPSRIIPDGSQNKSLRTLKIHFNSSECTDRSLHWLKTSLHWLKTLDQLFLLFPKISNFLFLHHKLRSEKSCSFLRSDSVLVDYYEYCLAAKQRESHERINSSLHKYFVLEQMESIALSYVYYPWLYWTLLKDVKDLTKITEVALDLKTKDVEYHQKFLEFASHQVHLQKIRCISHQGMSDEMVELLMSFISKVPELRMLCLFLEKNIITWKNEWSMSLSSSCLETLHISCEGFDCAMNLEYPICTTLTDLEIEGDELEIVSLLKSFPNLKALSLGFADNETLEYIGSHQLGLESLNVEYVEMEGDDEGPQSSSAINKLKQLKYLKIPNSMSLNPKNLPCLKYLHVHRGDAAYLDNPNLFDMDRFCEYLAECPLLEVVYIDCCIFIRQLWDYCSKYRKWFVQEVVDMIQEAKYLKVLFLEVDPYFQHKKINSDDDWSASDEDSSVNEDPDNTWNLTEKDVLPIFEACPTLQVLIHTSIFVKDVVAGCVKKQQRNDLGKNEFLNMFLNPHQNNFKKCTSVGLYIPPVHVLGRADSP